MADTDDKIIYNYRDVFYMSHPDMEESDDMISPLHIGKPRHDIRFSRVIPVDSKQCHFCLIAAAHYIVNSGHLTVRQNLNNYQLLLTQDGVADVTYNGRDYRLTAGTALLVDCRKKHRYAVTGDNYWEYKHFHFQTDYPHLLLNEMPAFFPNYGQAERIFDELAAFSCTPEANSPVAAYIYSNYIDNILTCLLRIHSTRVHDKGEQQFQEMVEYIYRHYQEPLSLATLSKRFHYSESYFIRLFKKYYGDTPYQFLIRYRLGKVRELLMEGQTVQEAALTCGFNSTSAYYHALSVSQEGG